MIAHLPTGLFDDELLYSALARSVDMMGIPTARDMLKIAFGSEVVTAVIALPNLLRVASGNLLCFSDDAEAGERLLWQHTLYPYYARFVSPTVAGRAAAAMLSAGGAAAYGMLGVRSSRVSAPCHLRYCMSCVRMDREANGMSHWRRAHQLPGSTVCVEHGDFLRSSGRLTSRSRQRPAFHSLETSMSDADRPCGGHVSGSFDTSLAISRLNGHILQPAAGASDVGLCREAWDQRRVELAEAGFLRGSRQRDTARLRGEVVASFGAELLAEIGCSPGPADSDDWIARMARPPRRSAHPLYHALLGAFLGYTPVSARSSGGGVVPTSAPAAIDVPSPAAVDVPSPAAASEGGSGDGELRALIADGSLSLRAIARRVGVDTRTVKRRAIAIGVWRDAWRSTPELRPATRARDAQIGRLRQARRRWWRFRRANPCCTRTEMKEAMPGAFALLYRRDRAWLDANSPARMQGRRRARGRRSTVDWAARDVDLATAIEGAGVGLAAARPGRAVRPGTLGRITDRLALVEQHLGRLPVTRAALLRLCDDPLALARRRLDAAVAAFSQDGRPAPAASVLARAAGLGPTRAVQLAVEIEAGLATIAVAVPEAGHG